MTVLDTPGLVWVDELPPRDRPAPPLPHAEWAAALRANPHRWAALVGLLPPNAGMVSSVHVAAPYRPAGSFQTHVGGGLVHARYVGAHEVIR